jgi:dihydroorotate dehydrogenase
MGTYRIDRSYDWNYAHGPVWDGPLPRLPTAPLKRFLGLPVRSRLGVAAGLLLNARWVEFYARLGYDIVTYKTVRSRARRCHPMPNWVTVDAPEALGHGETRCVTKPRRDADPAAVTASVSFGMPSKDPKVWMPDVARARKALKAGQVLVVSVVASPASGDGERAMIDDFANLAAMAREAGAQVVEANLSCPNVCTAEGDIYLDAGLSGRIARAMRAAAGPVPVSLKVGHVPDRRRLGALIRAVAGEAAAVVLVNGVSRRLHRPDGTPAYGEGRETAGILGRAIHEPAVLCVASAVDVVRKERLDLQVIAVGGVASPEDAADFFSAGAHAVMMGSAPMYDPLLAARIKRVHPEW